MKQENCRKTALYIIDDVVCDNVWTIKFNIYITT